MEDIIENLESLKHYINNIQNESELNLYKLGYRLGIILTELDRIQLLIEESNNTPKIDND